jgi:hypothetical protein
VRRALRATFSAITLVFLVAACTATQHRHVVVSEPLSAPAEPVAGRVLDDFNAADAAEHWTLYDVEGSVHPLEHEVVTGAMHLRSDSSAGLIWRQLEFDPGAEPLLSWRWKVSRTFDTSSPLSPELDNFPARMLVGFDSGWDGAGPVALAWRGKVERATGVTPPPRAICYTFGGEVPSSQAVDATFGDGRIAVINLRTTRAVAGVWHSEVRDVAADYQAIFRERAPQVIAFALGCDSHRLNLVAEAWFDDLTVYGREAYAQFSGRLESPPQRTNPLLTWLVFGTALLAAAVVAGTWAALRRRDRLALREGEFSEPGRS